MAKGYWILHVTVHNAGRFQEYVRLDTPIVERFGGRFLARGGTSELSEGALKERHVIVEFPDYAAAQACYASGDYQSAAKLRFDAAEADVVIVEGCS